MRAADDGVGECRELVQLDVSGLDEVGGVVRLMAEISEFIQLCPFRSVDEVDGERIVHDGDMRCGAVCEPEPACGCDRRDSQPCGLVQVGDDRKTDSLGAAEMGSRTEITRRVECADSFAAMFSEIARDLMESVALKGAEITWSTVHG